jgi:hypothetical protein
MSREANLATTKKMGEAGNAGHLEELHQVFAAPASAGRIEQPKRPASADC